MTQKTSVDHQVASSRIGALKDKAQHMVDKVQEETAEEVREPKKEAFKISNLRDLVFLGRMEKELTFGDFTFKVSTINAEQSNKIIELLSKSKTEVLTYSIVVTLSEAIISINDIPLENIAQDMDDEVGDIFQKKIKLISGWQTTLTSALFKEYNSLMKTTSEFFKMPEVEKKDFLKE